MNERFERAPIGILEVTPDGTVTGINEAACDLLETDSNPPWPIESVFPSSVDDSVPAAFADGPPTERSVEEYYPGLDRWLSVSVVPTDDAVTVYLENKNPKRNRERENERLRDELDRLADLNGVISTVLGELIDASTREEIAETVCTRLGRADRYEFTWFGEREIGGDDITVRASAGNGGRTFDRIKESLGTSADLPEQLAVETATPQLIQSVAEDKSLPETVRRAAFADGLQSLLAFPLTYGSTVYGVVGVYSTEPEAFSVRERSSFATLGSVAGFAVNAARNRTLLLSDTIVELTLQVSDPAEPLVGAATELDAEFTVEGFISQDDDRLLGYLTVEDTAPAELDDVFSDDDRVDVSRIIDDGEDGGTVEVGLASETALGILSAHGATVREAKFGSQDGRIEVQLPPEDEIRRIADAVTRRFDADVLTKRERDRELATAKEFRDNLRDRLTDRQATALRAAFLADYFESPRGSNAEEVADALGITGPTLLYHLRASQRKLLEEFFEATDTDRSLSNEP